MRPNQPDLFTAPSTLTPRHTTYPFISPSQFATSLTGQRAIVTGSGRGIGRCIALALAAAGAAVAVVARRKQDIDAVVSQIQEQNNGVAVAIAADVAEPNVASRIVSEAETGLGGKIDILINNAGMTRYGPFEEEPENMEAWWKVLEVNLLGAVALTRAVIPGMLQKKAGVIISITSTSGSQDMPFNSAYAVSKAGLIKFHQDLHVEVAERGIVNYAVHPGTVATDLAQTEGALNMDAMARFPKMAEIFQSFQGVKLQTPELAADTIVALCAHEKCKRWLAGKYIDCQYDLGEVLKDAEQGEESRIAKERLYHLKLDEL